MIYNNIEFKKKERLLNNGLKNIGFTSIEALMEAIDDSIDARAKNIEIKIFEEDYAGFNSKLEKNITAKRYCYIIIDDGDGKLDVNKIFDFGNEKEEIYISKKEYYTKNGKYRYGAISHINVGEEVYFYSKIKGNNKWNVCGLLYNRKDNCGYISEKREITKEEEEMFKLKDIDLSIESGSILLVRGIKKTNAGYKDINKFCEAIINELGVTYYDYLSGRNRIRIVPFKGSRNITMSKKFSMGNMTQVNRHKLLKIKVNGQDIKPLNPLCTDLNDISIKPVVFGKYKITLGEVFEIYKDELDEDDKKSELSKIFTENELKRMAIEIKLVAIKKKKELERYPQGRNLNEIYYPNYNYKGFYNKRNNRYIGRAMGMLGIVVDHPSHARFRGEISFTPVFDELFLIQINKNRNSISNLLRELIEMKISEDENLKGDGANAKIRNFLETGKFANELTPHNDFETRIINLERKSNELREKLKKYNQNIDIVNEILEKTRVISLEEEINELEERFAAEKSKYEENNKILFLNFSNLISRIKKYNSASKLKESTIEWMNNMKAPDVEGEIYGIFLVIYLLFKDYFDFDLKGYTTSTGVDLVATVKSELFEEYKFKERYGSLINVENGNVQYINNGNNIDNNINEMYTFIELKNKLLFTDKNKNILIGSNGEKVKVIYLKDIIEKLSGGKFKK